MLKEETAAPSRQIGSTKVPLVRGSRLSLRNALLLVSSGVSSLDNFLGGGLPVGTLCCIEEDRFGVYSELILRHFIAEGVLNGHHNFIASYGGDARQMVESLPLPVNDGGTMTQGNNLTEQMKIAWRYENLQSKEVNAYSQFGHIYDTSKFMDREKVSSAIKFWEISYNLENSSRSSLSGPYLSLLTSIEKEIEEVGCKVDSPSDKRNVVRIALCSIGSPLWSSQTDSKVDFGKSEAEFLLFIYFLKALLRNSYAVCMITIPSRLFKTAATLPRLRNVVDIGIRLEAFADSDKEVNELYREYCGLFRFSKLFSINTIVPHSSESLDLAMKLKRKRFIIEKLCLAPELSGPSDSNSGMGCGSNLPSSGKGVRSLDF